MSKITPVVLCGGVGTRLWPLSRRSLPKQFVSLMGDKSLLQMTFERVADFSYEETVWTVANEDYRFLVRDTAEMAGVRVRNILEPVGRNTAAAMAAAALNVGPDQLLLFLPADHYVPDERNFVETVNRGIAAAEAGAFVTFGVKPTHPHTGYGYIQAADSDEAVKAVKCFVEKPDVETAFSYIASKDFYWNAGIFLVRAGALVEALSLFAHDIFESVQMSVEKQDVDGGFIRLDKKAFMTCRSESIDYAVLEKHQNVVMVPFEGVWSDVGSWGALAELSASDQNDNCIIGQGRAYEAESTYIHAKHRPVVALGTKELFIVDTSDAVLVANKSYAEKVKDVVASLEHEGLQQAFEHRHVSRPWGEYDCIDEGHRFKVKRIKVKAGSSLSLQLHHHRAEHWVVVKGTARVTCGNKTFLLSENESTYIPTGMEHRLENPGAIVLEMIEVQSGSYLGEDDIRRLDDDYGRSSD